MLMVSSSTYFFIFLFHLESFFFIELACPPISCGAGQFLCERDRRCINATRRCDGIAGMETCSEQNTFLSVLFY